MLNTVDIVAIVVMLFGALNGLRRGLSRELAGTVSVVLALFLGIGLYRPLGEFVAERTRLGELSGRSLAFALTVIVAVIVMILLRLLLKHAIKVIISDKAVDRAGGMIAGFLKSAVVVIIVFIVFSMWPDKYLHRVFAVESLIGRTVVENMPEFREQAREIEKMLKDAE